MFAKALFAFLVLPGVVAYAVPAAWLLADSRAEFLRPYGLAPLAVGTIALLWCVSDFYIAGKGTLAPWTPPVNLVVRGLYRCTRNPMYIAVVVILLGWAITFDLPALFIYAAIVAAAFHLRVVFGEEPWLALRHGSQWNDYARKVPRWLW